MQLKQNKQVKETDQICDEFFRFNSTTFVVHVKLLCPELKMHGIYDMHGKLTQTVPIEGNGAYDLLTSKDTTLTVRNFAVLVYPESGLRLCMYLFRC